MHGQQLAEVNGPCAAPLLFHTRSPTLGTPRSSPWVWGGGWGPEGPHDAVPWLRQAKDATAKCGEACGMGRVWP